MTTVVQVKKVVGPLLLRNPDLVLVKRMVLVKPVRHLLRCINIDRSSDPRWFVPTWAVVHLFQYGMTFFGFFFGKRVIPEHYWDIAKADVAERMAEAIEQQALPLLRRTLTIDDFLRFCPEERLPSDYWDSRYDLRFELELANGNLSSARRYCEFLIEHKKYSWVTDMIYPMIKRDDRQAIAKLLHEFEAAAVKNLGLVPYWESTPFPIEQG